MSPASSKVPNGEPPSLVSVEEPAENLIWWILLYSVATSSTAWQTFAAAAQGNS